MNWQKRCEKAEKLLQELSGLVLSVHPSSIPIRTWDHMRKLAEDGYHNELYDESCACNRCMEERAACDREAARELAARRMAARP